MVGNTLEIADAVKHHGNAVTVCLRKILIVQLNKIGSQFILVPVYLAFHLCDLLSLFLTVIMKHLKRSLQRLPGILCHTSCCGSSLLYCKCRFFQETGFQNKEFLIFLCRLNILRRVTDRHTCKLHKKIGERKKQ